MLLAAPTHEIKYTVFHNYNPAYKKNQTVSFICMIGFSFATTYWKALTIQLFVISVPQLINVHYIGQMAV